MEDSKKLRIVHYAVLASMLAGAVVFYGFCDLYVTVLEKRPWEQGDILLLNCLGTFALFYVWLVIFQPIKLAVMYRFRVEYRRIHGEKYKAKRGRDEYWFNRSSAPWWFFWMVWMIGFLNLWNECVIKNILDMSNENILTISHIPTAILLAILAYPLARMIADTDRFGKEAEDP